MTKSGPNGPKSRARARQERDGGSYTQALRGHGDAEQVGEVTITTITFSAGEPVPWEAPRTWRCHHCGQEGADSAGVERGEYVLPDGVTYLRPHCPRCLPRPETERFPAGRNFRDPKPPEWEEYDRESNDRDRTLSEAVRERRIAADGTDFYRCLVHKGTWNIGQRVVLPFAVLYDRFNDLYEHPCPTCIGSMTQDELARAVTERARSL